MSTPPRRFLMLPLTALPLRDETQARVGYCDDTVETYAELYRDGIELPPVVVYHDGRDYWIADGHHRVAAANRAGRTHIQAEVRGGGLAAARLEAARANAEHGLRRSRDDETRSIHFVLVDPVGRDWTSQKIATHCGVSVRRVEAIRLSTPWPTQPGLFGPVHVGRPPRPDLALEGPAKTRERAVRSARKLLRFCDQLKADPVAFLEEVLAEVRKRQQAARKGPPVEGQPSA